MQLAAQSGAEMRGCSFKITRSLQKHLNSSHFAVYTGTLQLTMAPWSSAPTAGFSAERQCCWQWPGVFWQQCYICLLASTALGFAPQLLARGTDTCALGVSTRFPLAGCPNRPTAYDEVVADLQPRCAGFLDTTYSPLAQRCVVFKASIRILGFHHTCMLLHGESTLDAY